MAPTPLTPSQPEQEGAREGNQLDLLEGEVRDPGLVRDLVAAGIPLERVAALMIYPSIHAAWADGSVQVLEQLGVMIAAARAELERPDLELALHWTRERPSNPDVLLDLSWRLYECVPAVSQRCSPEVSWSSARIVARASGGLLRLFPIDEPERVALAQISDYAAGRGLETERRQALSWRRDLEGSIPGLTLTRPESFEDARGLPLSNDFRAALNAIQRGPLMRKGSVLRHLSRSEARTFLRTVQRDPQRGLLPPVKRAFRSLSPSELALVGDPPSLEALTPWQAFRLAMLIVCRVARAPSERFDADELHAALGSEEPEDLERLERFMARDVKKGIEHDRIATPALLNLLVDSQEIEFVCRHYVRTICAVHRALKETAPALRHSFMIPLFGVHDARCRQAHAWCLAIDAERGVGCPLDPSAADAWWDSGRADSLLNQLLPALDYANLSALLVRLLLAPPDPAGDVALALIAELPADQRPLVAARLLVQWQLLSLVDEEEFSALVQRARAAGAPEAFLQRAREHHDTSDAEAFEPGQRKRAQRRLSALWPAAGLL